LSQAHEIESKGLRKSFLSLFTSVKLTAQRFVLVLVCKKLISKLGQRGLHGAPHPQLPATAAQNPEVEGLGREDMHAAFRAEPACITSLFF
jgi:hypothetical protein